MTQSQDPTEMSIDDALEADRATAAGAESRPVDEYGGDDATAAEQGNRDQDRMEAEDGEDDLPEGV